MERSDELSMDQSFLQSLEDIVLSNLENEQFGAEDLSKEIGLSRSQVHRKLQKINGKSITQFIREVRLEVALNLLKKEVGTASEIAYKVGFNSPAYFTKCFHEYFGYPPGETIKDKSQKFTASSDQLATNEKTTIIPIHPTREHGHVQHDENIEDNEYRKLTTIMFSDISGYTAIMGESERKALNLLKKNRKLHQSLIDLYHGKFIKEIGDAIMASFDSPSDAVHCAQQIMQVSKEEEDLKLHIGIHQGEVQFIDGDIYGDGVNIASRINSMAKEGEVLISEEVYKNVKNKGNIHLEEVGERKFKNVEKKIRIYCLKGNDKIHNSKPQLSNINRRFFLGAIGILVILLTAFLGWYFIPKELKLQSASGDKTEIDPSIAILPITYLSMEEDKQYMADGVMNAITSNLVKIKELKVIAGTSVQRYKEHNKDVRDIGKELEVSYILESSFQLVGNQARLFIRIHSAKEGSLVWSNEYDREWEYIFEVQSEVSQIIAREIAVTINPETKKIFEEFPTDDLAAYEFYLRGEEYYNRGVGEKDHRFAMQMYKKAIEIDSSFTLAWVGLASSSRSLYSWGFDRNQNRIELTRKFLDQAIQLNSNLAEVEMEHAKYIGQVDRRYEDALKIFEKLNSKYPRDAEIYSWMASIWRRMGDFDKALEHYMHALTLDPTNWHFLNTVGYFYVHLRDFQQAEETFLKIVELYPSREAGYWGIYYIYYLRGKIGKLSEMLHNYNIPIDSLTLQIEADLLEENYEAAILKILDRDNYVRIDYSFYYSNNYLLGLYYYLATEYERAKEYFYKEKLFLESKLPSAKDDVRIYCSLGIVYAGLGDKKKAIEAGERAIEICKATRSAFGCNAESYMARIYLMLGEYDKGIEILESLLSAPVGSITTEFLKNIYDWRVFMKNEKYRALVNDPRYQIKNMEFSN